MPQFKLVQPAPVVVQPPPFVFKQAASLDASLIKGQLIIEGGTGGSQNASTVIVHDEDGTPGVGLVRFRTLPQLTRVNSIVGPGVTDPNALPSIVLLSSATVKSISPDTTSSPGHTLLRWQVTSGATNYIIRQLISGGFEADDSGNNALFTIPTAALPANYNPSASTELGSSTTPTAVPRDWIDWFLNPSDGALYDIDPNANAANNTYLSLEGFGLGIDPNVGVPLLPGNVQFTAGVLQQFTGNLVVRGIEIQGISNIQILLPNGSNNITVGQVPSNLNLTIDGGTGNSTYNIDAVGAHTTINAGGGNATINVGNNGTAGNPGLASQILNNLTVDGAAHTTEIERRQARQRLQPETS